MEFLASVTFIFLLKELYLGNPYIIVFILKYFDQLLNLQQLWVVLFCNFSGHLLSMFSLEILDQDCILHLCRFHPNLLWFCCWCSSELTTVSRQCFFLNLPVSLIFANVCLLCLAAGAANSWAERYVSAMLILYPLCKHSLLSFNQLPKSHRLTFTSLPSKSKMMPMLSSVSSATSHSWSLTLIVAFDLSSNSPSLSSTPHCSAATLLAFCWLMVLEVVTVRKDNISRLIAEYLVGGFMRWW